ncbi:MAG: carboxypeptidase-like regulatory domain-containing protein, partial [Bacteroidota bacterium]
VRNEEFGILGKQFTATGSTAAFQASTDFTASDGASLDRVNLAWQHHTDLPISYRILRIDANQDTVQLDTVSRESDEDLALTYEDVYRESSNGGLRSGQTYQYCIEPYYAPTVTTYPPACDEGSVMDLAFAASDDTHPDRVRLSWNSLAEVVEELAIYENDLLIATLPATRQSFDRIAPVAGKPHRYRLEVKQAGATLIAATDTGSIAPNGTISGRVTTLDQELPVAGVTVIWSVTLSDTILTDSVFTDGTGYYAFNSLYYEESANFTIRVRKKDASFQEEEKAVTLSGETPNITLLDFKQLELQEEDEVNGPEFSSIVANELHDQDKLQFDLDIYSEDFPLYLDVLRDGEREDLVEFTSDPDQGYEWVDSTGVPGKRYLYQFKVFFYDQDTVRSKRLIDNATFPLVTSPTELSELALANGFMELSWAHTSTNFSGFRLLRGQEEIKALSTEEFTYADGKGIPGLEDYGLVAIRTVGGKEYRSDTVRLQVDFPAIPSPTELAATTMPDRVQLSWSIPEALTAGFDYSGFRIYRDEELIGTVYKGFPTEFIDYTGSPFTVYEYTVRTFRLLLGKVAESGPTATSETFPAVSPALTFTASDANASLPNSVELSWTTDPEARVDGYRMLRDGREIARINSNMLRMMVTANHAGDLPYSIQGFRKVAGEDQYSIALIDAGAPQLEADRELDPIQDFKASQDQAGQIGLSWSYPTFLTGSFRILRQSSTSLIAIATIDASQFLSKTTQDGQDIYHFSYVDADPAINQKFTYWIRAEQASFLSPYAYAEGRVPNGIRVRGRVYDEESGSGIANVRITLNRDGNALATYTDSSGHYLFEDILGRPAVPGIILFPNVTVSINEPGDAYLPGSYVVSSTVSEPTEYIINFTSKVALPALEETALAKVVTVSATALDCDLEAVIAWGADHNNYDGFEVARGVNVIGEVLKGEELVFKDESNTNPGALQVYQVRAFQQTPTGRLYSAYKSTGVMLPVFSPVQHLSASIAPEGNAVDLSWSHPCQSHTGFLISRNDEIIDTVYTDAANQFQDITGVPGEKYTYAITPFWEKANDLLKARAESVVVDYPEIAQVSDLQVAADFIRDYEIPFDPFTEGSVIEPTYFTNQVRLEWTYESPYCQGFAVFRDSILLSDTLNREATTYFDNSATPESMVEYKVMAILERDGKSYYSKPLTTSFAVPKLIKPIRMRQKVASGVVTISFHYPTEREITGFNVRRIPSGGSSIILNPVFTQSEITPSYFEFSDSTGIPGRTYVYVVQSFLEGEEEYTSSFSGRNAT